MLTPDMPHFYPENDDASEGWHAALEAVDATDPVTWGTETAKRIERMGISDRRDLILALAHGLPVDLRQELAVALLDY
jgi:hypothetical protein